MMLFCSRYKLPHFSQHRGNGVVNLFFGQHRRLMRGYSRHQVGRRENIFYRRFEFRVSAKNDEIMKNRFRKSRQFPQRGDMREILTERILESKTRASASPATNRLRPFSVMLSGENPAAIMLCFYDKNPEARKYDMINFRVILRRRQQQIFAEMIIVLGKLRKIFTDYSFSGVSDTPRRTAQNGGFDGGEDDDGDNGENENGGNAAADIQYNSFHFGRLISSSPPPICAVWGRDTTAADARCGIPGRCAVRSSATPSRWCAQSQKPR